MKIFKKLSKYLFEDVDDEEVAKKIDITPKEEVKPADETMEFQEATREIPTTPKEVIKEEVHEETYIEPSFEKPSFIEPIFSENEEKSKVEETVEDEIDFMVPSYNYEEVASKESYWKAAKKTFKPSPIISPIYGVRKMEEPYQNDEIVLSASPVKKRSVDEVRKKAYSYLSEEKEEPIEKTIDDRLEDTKKLSVTVGDAKDYYDELGLEYNVDYKDTSIEEEKQAKALEAPVIEEEAIKVPEAPNVIKEPLIKEPKVAEPLVDEPIKDLDKTEELKLTDESHEEDDDTDLFDLIEGMYVED